jgi:DNA replication protein DnaC
VDLIADIQASFDADRGDTEAKIMERYRNIPLLVLDDVEKIHAKAWSVSVLYRLINGRTVAKRPVFITSNYDANSLLTKTFKGDCANDGRAIIERLVGMNQWIEIRGKSLRRPGGGA